MPGARLAAHAVNRGSRHAAARVMRAVKSASVAPFASNSSARHRRTAPSSFSVKRPSATPGWFETTRSACRSRRAQRACRARCEAHARRIDVGTHVEQRAVLVDQHGAGQPLSRVKAMTSPFIGSTITSGTTVPGGYQHEAHGGRDVLGRLQRVRVDVRKRSSRNGVRIPPATIADTLTPAGRSSACSACDRPSSPHFVA